MSDTTPAIEIRDVVKRYAGSKKAEPKLALKGLSFDVPQGGVFGLLGPNGAGKSTLINIMAGTVNKTGGSIRIWGHDIDENPRNAKLSIGIVPQEIIFDPFFTPYEVLENQGGMYGLAKALRRSDELLRAVRLEDKRNAYARTLSGGMKRRLLIAKAMVHSPPILVLDEPTAGVDVELRKQLWELVGMMGEKIVAVTVDRDIDELPQDPRFRKCEKAGERVIEVTYDKAEMTAGQVLAKLQEQGFAIEDVSTREADLEDVFVQLTSAVEAA